LSSIKKNSRLTESSLISFIY